MACDHVKGVVAQLLDFEGQAGKDPGGQRVKKGSGIPAVDQEGATVEDPAAQQAAASSSAAAGAPGRAARDSVLQVWCLGRGHGVWGGLTCVWRLPAAARDSWHVA